MNRKISRRFKNVLKVDSEYLMLFVFYKYLSMPIKFQNITARRNPNYYMITNTRGKVVRFCLFKPAYKLGEDIIGTFDFTVATVSCIQVSVSLQCEEKTTLEGGDSNEQTRIMTFGNFHDVCLGYDYTQLILPIPLYVTPEFSTKLGKVFCFISIFIC